MHRWKPLGSTPYCCRACERGDAYHTKNCRGVGKRVFGDDTDILVAPSVAEEPASTTVALCERLTANDDVLFYVDRARTCRGLGYSIAEYVEVRVNQYGNRLPPSVAAAWKRTALVGSSMATDISLSGQPACLHIYVYRLRCVPENMKSKCIDVGDAGYQVGRQTEGRMHDHATVTGVNPCVQAALLCSLGTAQAIEDAIIRIEMQRSAPIRQIAFACEGGTHRSPGCACLLSSLFYPHAAIILSTRRTKDDAGVHLVQGTLI